MGGECVCVCIVQTYWRRGEQNFSEGRSDSFMHYIIACLHGYAYPTLKSNDIKLWLSLNI